MIRSGRLGKTIKRFGAKNCCVGTGNRGKFAGLGFNLNLIGSSTVTVGGRWPKHQWFRKRSGGIRVGISG